MLLSEMLTELRHEARISADVAHGSHLQNRHISLLRRTQEEVFAAYTWPSLFTTATVSLDAAQRYATYPELLNYDSINAVYEKRVDGDFHQLDHGIHAAELNQIDSDGGETADYVRKWQHYLSPEAEAVNQNMFEVWPVPNRATTLRFEGMRKLLPLVNPATDRSTVDGVIVVLHAAAELLAGQKAEDASLKIQKAQLRFDQMRQREAAPNSNMIVPNSGSARPSGQRFRVR